MPQFSWPRPVPRGHYKVWDSQSASGVARIPVHVPDYAGIVEFFFTWAALVGPVLLVVQSLIGVSCP